MNEVLRHFLRKFCLFFYDILIYIRSTEEHKTHLKSILHVLEVQQLFSNKNVHLAKRRLNTLAISSLDKVWELILKR